MRRFEHREDSGTRLVICFFFLLMYGKTAKPFWESGGSINLNNIPTNSSGDGMISGVDVFFRMFDVVADG